VAEQRFDLGPELQIVFANPVQILSSLLWRQIAGGQKEVRDDLVAIHSVHRSEVNQACQLCHLNSIGSRWPWPLGRSPGDFSLFSNMARIYEGDSERNSLLVSQTQTNAITKGRPTMLVLNRKEGQGVNISDQIKVRILSVNGNRVRIGIEAPRNVRIHRHEIYEDRKSGQVPIEPSTQRAVPAIGT
jgi:carbon storage regulator